MSAMRVTLLGLLVLLSFACGGAKPACPISEPIERGPAFLWKAHKDGSAVVWLYGTIHDAGLDAVPPAALAAFDSAPRLITELGETEPDPDEFQDLIGIKRGKGLDQLLPADDWWDLQHALRDKAKRYNVARVKPWFAMSLLTSYESPTPGLSMDVELAKRAKARKQPIEGLETWQEQLAMLDAAVSIADLQEAIHARKTMRCDLSRMIAAYRAGDTTTMQALLVIPRTEQNLLAPRNTKWLPAIEKQFSQGAFVAVGLGHLLGDHSVVALLQRAGYTVERIR
jgi:uncharacterized protein YbaP (TraB family)